MSKEEWIEQQEHEERSVQKIFCESGIEVYKVEGEEGSKWHIWYENTHLLECDSFIAASFGVMSLVASVANNRKKQNVEKDTAEQLANLYLYGDDTTAEVGCALIEKPLFDPNEWKPETTSEKEDMLIKAVEQLAASEKGV